MQTKKHVQLPALELCSIDWYGSQVLDASRHVIDAASELCAFEWEFRFKREAGTWWLA